MDTAAGAEAAILDLYGCQPGATARSPRTVLLATAAGRSVASGSFSFYHKDWDHHGGRQERSVALKAEEIDRAWGKA